MPDTNHDAFVISLINSSRNCDFVGAPHCVRVSECVCDFCLPFLRANERHLSLCIDLNENPRQPCNCVTLWERREWIRMRMNWVGAASFARNATVNRTIFTFRLIELTFIFFRFDGVFFLSFYSFATFSCLSMRAIVISPNVIYHRDSGKKKQGKQFVNCAPIDSMTNKMQWGNTRSAQSRIQSNCFPYVYISGVWLRQQMTNNNFIASITTPHNRSISSQSQSIH